MSCLTKYRGFACIVCLAVLMAPAPGLAQTWEPQRVIQLSAGGPYLGITMDEVTADNMSKYKLTGERGVIVSSVAKGSPAEAAALKEGDVILEYGGNQVWSTSQFSRLVQETPAGRKVDLVVSRDGKRTNLTAKIENRDGTRADAQIERFRDLLAPGNRAFEFREFRGPNAPRNEDRGLVVPAPAPAPGKPRLGVTLQPITDQLGEFLGVPGKKGALVASVTADSPSAGKLKSGDVIIGADGRTIDSPEDLTQFIRNAAAGAVTLKVIRDKRETTVVVNLPADENQKGYKL